MDRAKVSNTKNEVVCPINGTANLSLTCWPEIASIDSNKTVATKPWCTLQNFIHSELENSYSPLRMVAKISLALIAVGSTVFLQIFSAIDVGFGNPAQDRPHIPKYSLPPLSLPDHKNYVSTNSQLCEIKTEQLGRLS